MGKPPGQGAVSLLGRFFYCKGEASIRAPAGETRVEVWKGFEFEPTQQTIKLEANAERDVVIRLKQPVDMIEHGYYSGDPHIHIARNSERDDATILDLMQCEDIRYGAILGYNEPAGPYAGFMNKMDAPQLRGVGKSSVASRDGYHILSGQEYRTSTYGAPESVSPRFDRLPGESFNANDWPLYGDVGRETQQRGGYAFYAHGGYAQAIYADFVQGDVNGVELLQFAE